MVALNETTSELRPCRIAPRCRVTAEYPQGGTGIPAGEMNYPGAAAHMRPAAATGFRGADATNGFGSPPNALNINAPVLQDTYIGEVIQPNSRLYFIKDANWNTTAVVGYDATTGTWNVVQRYVYSPYGNIIILNANFTTTLAGTIPMVNNLYQGMSLDPVTGLYYERARWYSPSLGTWISQDPAGYINGADTYHFVGDGPVGRVDPSGFDCEEYLREHQKALQEAAKAQREIQKELEKLNTCPPPSPLKRVELGFDIAARLVEQAGDMVKAESALVAYDACRAIRSAGSSPAVHEVVIGGLIIILILPKPLPGPLP